MIPSSDSECHLNPEKKVMVLPSILKMNPFFRPVVWGGRRLSTEFGKHLPEDQKIGESFEVSAVPGMESVVVSGPLAGRNIRELTAEYGPDLLGEEVHRRYSGEFPLLIKLLDANDDLSIQVHPDDAYAQANHLGNFGKMEAWVVLRSKGGRVASGLKENVDRQALVSALNAGKVEDVVEFHPVSEGDIVTLPPGTVHALCRGVMIYEVQQSSSITFRLYDYNRRDADGSLRELHIDQSLDVIDFGASAAIPAPVDTQLAVASEHFTLEQYGGESDRFHDAKRSFSCLTILSGGAEIRSGAETLSLNLADTVVIPASRSFEITPKPVTRYLVSSVPC